LLKSSFFGVYLLNIVSDFRREKSLKLIVYLTCTIIRAIFANKYLFSIATRGRGEVRCLQASNTWSKKLKSGECELSKARSSQTSNCKYCIRFSTGKITKINPAFDLHNHSCDIATEVAVTKKSGTAITAAIDQVSEVLFLGYEATTYVHNGVVLSDVNIRSILNSSWLQLLQ